MLFWTVKRYGLVSRYQLLETIRPYKAADGDDTFPGIAGMYVRTYKFAGSKIPQKQHIRVHRCEKLKCHKQCFVLNNNPKFPSMQVNDRTSTRRGLKFGDTPTYKNNFVTVLR
jgi:hypothetical protein